MRFLKLFAVFLLCVSLCSCWDSIPIEDCAHPVIGAYDVPEDGRALPLREYIISLFQASRSALK